MSRKDCWSNQKNAGELAKALIRLIADPALRERLGARGLDTVQNFGWDKVAARVEAYYRQVLERRGLAEQTDDTDTRVLSQV